MVPFSIFFSSWRFASSIRSIAPPWTLVRMFTKTLFIQRIAIRIRAFDCTLVGKHACSREGVLGSNPTTPKFLPNVFVALWRLLRNAPSQKHHSRYITLFSMGSYGVIGFYELMGMFLVGLMHFLR